MSIGANRQPDGLAGELRSRADAPRDDVALQAPPTVRRDPTVARWPIVTEAVFSQLLIRERKRAERSNRPFILLSVTAKGRWSLDSSPTGAATLDTLVAATRETDILGWMQAPRMLGVLFAELGGAEPTQAVEAIRSRIAGEFERRLDRRAIADLSLEFHVYPEPASGRDVVPTRGSIDPLLYPDLNDGRHTASAVIKRTLDVTFALALLLACAPMLAIIALLVRLTSPGPVLFRQLRIGQLGKPFRMLKFRTMYVGVDPHPHSAFVADFIKGNGGSHACADVPLFKLTNDPRITPLGRFLRKTSLDELPQLWNVLIGEMSLVGPRPPIPYELDHYAPWHLRRVLEAKPGITGLWQVTGRSRTTFDEMVRLDLRYVTRRSLLTDLWILIRTARTVLSGTGAC